MERSGMAGMGKDDWSPALARRLNLLHQEVTASNRTGLTSARLRVFSDTRASGFDTSTRMHRLRLLPSRCHADRLGSGSKRRARHANQRSSGLIKGKAEDLGRVIVLYGAELVAGR